MSDAVYVWGTGRRKCAVAQVRLYAGEGGITVNGKPLDVFFPRVDHRSMIEAPLHATDMVGKYLRITGAVNSPNNGTFLIDAFQSTTQIDIINASGVLCDVVYFKFGKDGWFVESNLNC